MGDGREASPWELARRRRELAAQPAPKPARAARKRWSASAIYRAADGGSIVFSHRLEELDELASIVEGGPDWATLDRIEIRYNVE